MWKLRQRLNALTGIQCIRRSFAGWQRRDSGLFVLMPLRAFSVFVAAGGLMIVGLKDGVLMPLRAFSVFVVALTEVTGD